MKFSFHSPCYLYYLVSFYFFVSLFSSLTSCLLFIQVQQFVGFQQKRHVSLLQKLGNCYFTVVFQLHCPRFLYFIFLVILFYCSFALSWNAQMGKSFFSFSYFPPKILCSYATVVDYRYESRSNILKLDFI